MRVTCVRACVCVCVCVYVCVCLVCGKRFKKLKSRYMSERKTYTTTVDLRKGAVVDENAVGIAQGDLSSDAAAQAVAVQHLWMVKELGKWCCNDMFVLVSLCHPDCGRVASVDGKKETGMLWDEWYFVCDVVMCCR